MRKFIDLLESQLGYSERGGAYTKFGDWYGKNVEFDADYTSAPWCDMMLSWAAHKLGYEEWMGQFAWTVSHAKWFRKHDAWGRKPEPGAFVFFDWSGSHDLDRIDHVGIVTRVEGHTIHTIEGNIDGGVLKRKERDTSKVVGYGYPWRIKERLDREARQNQVDPVLPPANTDTGLLQQTDSTLGALIPYSEVTIVQPPLAARAQPSAKPTNGAQQAADPTPQRQPAQPQAQPQTQPQALPQATSSAATNADKAAKKGKHAKPATADTKAVTREPLTPLVDASASHPSPVLDSPTLVGSALVAALALLAVAKTRHMRARPAPAAAAPAAPGRRRHRRPRRPAAAPAAGSAPVMATMVRRTTADATLTTRTTAAARATAGAAPAAGATATAGATLVAITTARGAAALAGGASSAAGAGRSAHRAADALLETVEPVSASRAAALGGSPSASRSASGYGAGAASSADFFPVDPAATGPMPLHPDILASLSEDASAAPLEPTAIHQGTPLEALGARRIVPAETSPDPAAHPRFVPLETAAAQWGPPLETIAARLSLPPGTFAIPEATSRFDAFGARPVAMPVAMPDVADLLRDAQTLVRDAQGLPREQDPWDAFGRTSRPVGLGEPVGPGEPSPAPYALLDGPRGASHGRAAAADGLHGGHGGHARTEDGLRDRSARSSGGYRGRRRRSGHPVEEPAAFSPDAAPRGRRHRGAAQHRAEQPHHMDARRIDPYWAHPQPVSRHGDSHTPPHHADWYRSDSHTPPHHPDSHRSDSHTPAAPHADAHPGDSRRSTTHGSDAHRGDAHRAGGRWDVRQLEPRWSDQFAQDGPLRGRRHRLPATPPLSAPPLREASTESRVFAGAASATTGQPTPSTPVLGVSDRSPAAAVTDSPARDGRRRRGRHRA
ncbi:CHAP domain-containing protein [Nonomuraea rhodomycinica]|uniref:CHAP domain-containing protein n=1 Tax=Nonomuraea rhodomycinica TaxID=1712872 RepID=A0A7Y6ILX4_9ACTN|nr:CHAP domain-containing protein [Nonomuraea rhodomycinica]NUW40602.1 CHAP domain-containing protein [Nonomuraea rhodomycinica]